MDPVLGGRVGVRLLRELSVDCCDRGVAWCDRGRAGLMVSDAMPPWARRVRVLMQQLISGGGDGTRTCSTAFATVQIKDGSGPPPAPINRHEAPAAGHAPPHQVLLPSTVSPSRHLDVSTSRLSARLAPRKRKRARSRTHT